MTAVEWLEKKFSDNEFDDCFYLATNQKWFEQAKEMHKAEHGKTWDAALDAGQSRAWNVMRAYSDFDDWYAETYGSKGSDETKTIEKESYPEFPDRIWLYGDGRKLTPSQTEISDEEIEKAAWENPCLSRQDVYELFDEVFKDKTLEGMFKISASKEVRQFKESLRQLAKEKYREQLKQRQ